MLPPCACTRISAGLFALSSDSFPQRTWRTLKPASKSTRLVNGEVHVAWPTLLGCARMPRPLASGLEVAEPPEGHATQRIWSSYEATNLFRGVACHVRRMDAAVQCEPSTACSLRSGS